MYNSYSHSFSFTLSYHIRTPSYQPSSLHCHLSNSPTVLPSLPFLLPIVRCAPSTPVRRLMDAKYVQWTGDDMNLANQGNMII